MPKKVVIHCVKLGLGVCNRFETKMTEWGNPDRVMSIMYWCSSQVNGNLLK
jgi:hypothetical protein